MRIEVRPPKLPYLITLTPLAFQSPVGYAKTESQRQIIVGSKLECKQTDGRTDTTDCIIFPVNTVGNKLTLYLLTFPGARALQRWTLIVVQYAVFGRIMLTTHATVDVQPPSLVMHFMPPSV